MASQAAALLRLCLLAVLCCWASAAEAAGTTAEDAQSTSEASNGTHEAVGPVMEREEVPGVNLSASAVNVSAQATGAATGQSRLRGASAICADRLDYCSRWASKGYCAPKWVSRGRPVGTYWCPAACGKCGGSGGDQMNALLDRHNFYRRKHHAPALSWDSSLAAQAQGWADRCVWKHSSMGNGENLFTSTGSFSGAAATDSWYDEIKYYNFNRPGFSMKTGHFTQVVWKASRRIGCAVKFCDQLQGAFARAQFLVCEYSPPGNVLGQFRANVLP